jgi:hypothetical protein
MLSILDALVALSVTVIVQFEYVPLESDLKLIVLLPTVAISVAEEQLPP